MDLSWLTGLMLMLAAPLGLALATGADESGDGGEGGNDGAETKDGGEDGNKGYGIGTVTNGFKLTLTSEQRQRLIESGELELSDEQYTAGVRGQMDVLRKRATDAEKRAKALEDERKEQARKQLEEEKRFQELYESEKTEREKEVMARRDLMVRMSFMTAAAKAGIIDPDAAYVIAKTMAGFGAVAVGEDGAVTGVDELVKQLVETKPYLIGPIKNHSVGSASNPSSTKVDQKPAETQAEADERVRQRVRSAA